MFADSALLSELASFTRGDRGSLLPSRGGVRSALRATEDVALPPVYRDRSLWLLAQDGARYSTGLIQEVASQDGEAKIRKSASWALMRLGKSEAIKSSLKKETDPNLVAWKLHLLAELQDDSLPVDTRPIRLLPEAPFDFTMPLEVEGVVEFRDPEGNWHSFVTGPVSNERLIGDLTPAVNADSFQSTLVLQKRIRNIHDSGADHIEGYLLKGLARRLEPNVFRHQYEGLSRHTVYRSGIVGDESKGVIEGATASISRMADTHLTSREGVAFPYPHSVRGTFRGFVYINPELAVNPERSLDGNLQIISPMDEKAGSLVNGVFSGSFRGIPQDLDGDGVVELNGIEMAVTKTGVVDKTEINRAARSLKGDRWAVQGQIDRLRKELEALEKSIS